MSHAQDVMLPLRDDIVTATDQRANCSRRGARAVEDGLYPGSTEGSSNERSRRTGTLAQVAAALRARQLSSVELTRAVLARVDAAQGALNAFVTVDAEGALAQARAADAALAKGDAPPLAGVPIAHKDVIMTAGLRPPAVRACWRTSRRRTTRSSSKA